MMYVDVCIICGYLTYGGVNLCQPSNGHLDEWETDRFLKVL